jgi:hypothetical protein
VKVLDGEWIGGAARDTVSDHVEGVVPEGVAINGIPVFTKFAGETKVSVAVFTVS